VENEGGGVKMWKTARQTLHNFVLRSPSLSHQRSPSRSHI